NFEQEVERQDGQRANEEITYNQRQRQNHQNRHRAENETRHALAPLLLAREVGLRELRRNGLWRCVFYRRAHALPRMPRTIRSALRLTAKVIENSRMPMMKRT